MSRRVLITGGAGFVGAALTRQALADGAEVALLVRPTSDLTRLTDVRGDVRFITGDLAAPDSYAAALGEFRPEACFHLAWVTEPGKYVQSPLNAAFMLQTIDLLRCLNQVGCGQVVATGTCLEYAPSDDLLREESPLQYTSPYASAKNFTAQLGLALAIETGMRFAWARLFYMYGRDDHPKRLLPSLIAALRDGRPFPTTDGVQQVDYLHVRDVAAGLWALAGQHGMFNVCSGAGIAVADVISRVGALMSKPELIQLGALQRPVGMSLRVCGSRDKLTDATGWTPEVSLDDGLQDLIAAGDA